MKLKDSTLKSISLRRNRLKSRKKRQMKRKYWSSSMNNPWRTRLRGEKEKKNRNYRTIRTSNIPGMINWQLSKNKKIMTRSSENTCMQKMLKSSKDRWKRNNSKERKNWDRNSRLTKRLKELYNWRKDNSKVTPRSAWKNGSQTERIYTLSSSTCLPQWRVVVDCYDF